ncbi:MAG: hypothetical protein L3K06_02945, partial [Thermoplasmata archaeon]|nr:hypothetical protein [Thermoplasmata archaeon]
SVWDNASSYDQIGIANAGGVFGIAYSTTDYCANTYYYSADAQALTPGVTYNFSMGISQGVVTFVVTDPTGAPVWTLPQSTGGAYFVEAPLYSCFYAPFGNVTAFYDYTDYEEVYLTNGNVPPYDFYFGQNLADNTPVTAFGLFTTPPLPGPITVPINGDNAIIANEPYSLFLNQPNSTYALVSPTSDRTVTVDLGIANVDGSGPVTLASYKQPTGFVVALSTTSATPPATFSADVTVPAGTPAANYSVGFSASDGSGDPNQLSVWFQVVPGLSVAIHVGPKTFADLGQNITISAVPGGGIGGLGFEWGGLPPGCAGSSQVLHCQPAATGVFLVTVNISDAVGDFAASPVFGLVVNPDPIVSVVASPSQTDVNQTVTWYGAASAGSGGFTYAWLGLFAGCKVTGSIATCVPAAPGTYVLQTVVTDAAAFSVTSAPASVQVAAAPHVALTLSTYTVDVQQPIHLTALATGGGGGFSYVWTGLPSGCASSASVATCAFTSPGSFLVTVSAYDVYQVVTTAARAYVTVSSDPVLRFAASSPSLDLGQSTQFTVQVTGGAPGYSYHYDHLPVGCTDSSTASLACTPTTVSNYSNLSVAVTDRNNWTVVSSINFSVFADPTVALVVTPAQSNLGDPVVFSAHVTGGAGGEAYAWQNFPGGCQAAPTATVSCTPDATGTTTVSVMATDRNGFSVNATAVVTVVMGPSILSSPWPYVVAAVVIVGVVVAVLWSRRRRAPPPEETEAA